MREPVSRPQTCGSELALGGIPTNAGAHPMNFSGMAPVFVNAFTLTAFGRST
jgi:hypothetical protein